MMFTDIYGTQVEQCVTVYSVFEMHLFASTPFFIIFSEKAMCFSGTVWQNKL